MVRQTGRLLVDSVRLVFMRFSDSTIQRIFRVGSSEKPPGD